MREISCLNDDRIYQDIYISIDSSCSSWHFDSLIWTKNLLCEKLIPHFSQNSAPKTSKIFGVNYFGQYSSWHRQIIVQSIHYSQLVHTLHGNPLFKFPSTWTIHAKSMCFFKVFVSLVPPVSNRFYWNLKLETIAINNNN
jgi:hypothetical protein